MNKKNIRLDTAGGGKGDSLGILQEAKIRPCEQMVSTQPRIHPRK